MKRLFLILTSFAAASAQVTWSDYERALGTRTKYQNLVIGMPGPASWIGGTDRFWYRTSVEGGARFVLVDAAGLKKEPAFDHERMAAGLNSAAGEKYTGVTLPFSTFHFADGGGAIT